MQRWSFSFCLRVGAVLVACASVAGCDETTTEGLGDGGPALADRLARVEDSAVDRYDAHLRWDVDVQGCVPEVALEPRSFDFGTTSSGTFEVTFSVVSVGCGEVSISSVRVRPPGEGFRVSTSSAALGPLPGGSAASVSLSFARDTPGPYEASVLIQTDAQTTTSTNIPGLAIFVVRGSIRS